MRLLGPLFRYELTRMARRGLQPRLRALFAVLLLVALFVTYLGAFPGSNPLDVLVSTRPLPIKDAAGFAERFFVAFLIVQLIVVCLITPPITGGAMAEEKERGSLDFLLSSPLTNWEIVVGKLAARLVFVAGVVLTGMPVLMFTLFFGGVDPTLLLIGYGITLMTAFSLSAFSLFCAVVSSGLRPTLLWSYSAVVGLTVFGFMCCCLVVPIFFSPFSTLYFLLQADSTPFGRGGFLQQEVMLFGFAVIHGLVGAIFFGVSVAKVRIGAPVRYFDPRYLPQPPAAAPRPAAYAAPLYPHAPDPLTAAPPERQPAPPVPARVLPAVAIAPAPPPRPAYVPVGPRRWRRVPPVRDDNPMVWKERYFGGRIWPHWDSPWHALAITLLAVGASALGLVMLPITLQGIQKGSLGQYWGPVARFFYSATVPLAMLGAAVVTSGSVTGERQRQTLLSLLTLPGRRHEIITAKLWAGMRAVWLTSLVAFGAVVVALFTGYLSLPGAVVGVLLPVPWVFAAAAYGLWLSVRCSTSARATGAVLVSLLALALVPPMAGSLAADLLGGGGPEATWAQGVFNGTSPPVAAWVGLTPWDDWQGGRSRGWSGPLAATAGALGGAVLAALFGVLFWLRARHEFENEGRH